MHTPPSHLRLSPQCFFTAKDGRITRAGAEKKEKWPTWAPFMTSGPPIGKRENPPVATLRIAAGERLNVHPLSMPELQSYLEGNAFKMQASDVHSLQQLVPGCGGSCLR